MDWLQNHLVGHINNSSAINSKEAAYFNQGSSIGFYE